MSKSKGGSPVMNDPPRNELKAAVGTISEVVVRAKRRLPNNKNVTLPAFTKSIQEILDGTLELYLQQYCGGGEYIVELFSPQDATEPIAPKWRIILQGTPKDHAVTMKSSPEFLGYQPTPGMLPGPTSGFAPAGGMPGAPGAPGMAGALPAGSVHVPPAAWSTPGIATPQYSPQGQVVTPPPNMPPFAMMWPIPQQWRFYYQSMQQQGRLPAGASMHSDAMADGWARTFDSRQQRESDENKALRDRLAALEAEKVRAQSEGQIAALQMQIQHMMMQIQQSQNQGPDPTMMMMMQMMQQNQPKTDWVGMAGVVASLMSAIVPAWMNAGTQRSSSEMQAQLKQMEMSQQQQQSMIAILSQGKNGSDKTDLVGLLGAVMPLFLEYLQQKSPETAMALQQGQVQNQMMLTKMMMDFIEAQQGPDGERPWWAPALEGLLGGLKDVAPMAAMAMQGGGAPQLPPPAHAMPPQAQAHPQAAPAQAQPVKPAVAVVPGASGQPADSQYAPVAWEELGRVDPEAAATTKLVLNNIPVDQGFHTNEWRLVLFNLHRRLDPEQMADLIVTQLDACKTFDMLPKIFEDVFQNPAKVRMVLQGLPINKQDPQYTQRVIGLTLEYLQEMIEADDGPRPPMQAAGGMPVPPAQQPAPPPPQPVVTPPPAPAPTPSGKDAIDMVAKKPAHAPGPIEDAEVVTIGQTADAPSPAPSVEVAQPVKQAEEKPLVVGG